MKCKFFAIFTFVFLVLSACNGSDSGTTTSTDSPSPSGPTTAPSAPTGVTATGTETGIVINWTAVSGASSYNIYWNTSDGVSTSSTKIENASLPYTHSSLTRGYTYYYVVTAVNSYGESPISAEVSSKMTTLVGTFSKYNEATGTKNYWSQMLGTSAGSRYMSLYLSADVKGSGKITSIALRRYGDIASDITCPNVTVKMGHTSVATLDVTFANNIENGKGSEITVLNNASLTIPAGTADTYFTIDLAAPFIYNGTDNLVVEVARTSACSASAGIENHETAPAINGNVFNGSSATALTGSTSTYRTDMKFVFSGGSNILPIVSTTSNLNPFNTSAKKIQQLYTAAEIAGSGYISGIGFAVGNDVGTAVSYTVSLKIGSTSLSELTTTFDSNFTGTSTVMANNITFTVPPGITTGTYIWIPVQTDAFYYNGTDNLVVQIESTPINITATQILKNNSGTNTRLWADGGASTGTLDGNKYLFQFRFAGAPMDVITADNNYDSYPFSDSTNNKRQYLYLAPELSNRATITKIACRLKNDANAASHDSFNVVLGHTSSMQLGTTFASNFEDSQTVYSGTFSVPAGLKAGDWIEIPLTTPFTYSAAKNLIVEISTLAGTASNQIFASGDVVKYANRHAFSPNNTASTGTVNSYITDLRLIEE